MARNHIYTDHTPSDNCTPCQSAGEVCGVMLHKKPWSEKRLSAYFAFAAQFDSDFAQDFHDVRAVSG